MPMRTRNILTDAQYKNLGTTREEQDKAWAAYEEHAKRAEMQEPGTTDYGDSYHWDFCSECNAPFKQFPHSRGICNGCA
jgi:hypothetical protein